MFWRSGAIPENISIVRLTVPWRTIDPGELGTFVDRDTELWSFVPLPILTSLLEPIVDIEASKALTRKESEASPDSKRVLSWLLQKHFESEVQTFEAEEGLVLEHGRKHRAYFSGKHKGDRTIVWSSAQRRGNKRDVVKKRAEPPRSWFETEGFGYEIVDVGGNWCVRIKPISDATEKILRAANASASLAVTVLTDLVSSRLYQNLDF